MWMEGSISGGYKICASPYTGTADVVTLYCLVRHGQIGYNREKTGKGEKVHDLHDGTAGGADLEHLGAAGAEIPVSYTHLTLPTKLEV